MKLNRTTNHVKVSMVMYLRPGFGPTDSCHLCPKCSYKTLSFKYCICLSLVSAESNAKDRTLQCLLCLTLTLFMCTASQQKQILNVRFMTLPCSLPSSCLVQIFNFMHRPAAWLSPTLTVSDHSAEHLQSIQELLLVCFF